MATDYTVRVFDQFYNLDLVVGADEYEVVYSYFRQYMGNDATAKGFSDVLFRISNLTQIPALDLLQTFQTGQNPSISRTMAYYLNSVSNKTVLYGVNDLVAPNQNVLRNIIYDSLVVPLLVADFSRTPSSGCVPLTVTFTDTSTGAVSSWLWDFGDGNTSTDRNPVHTYTLPGSYTVTLTVADSTSTASTTQPITATVIPVASFTNNPSSGCAPLTVNFTNTSTGTITSRLWNFGDGNTSTALNPVHTYTTGGVKTVTLTVSNSCGSDTYTSSISVTAAPVASFTRTPATGCVPLTVNFTDTSTGTITSRLWNFGDGGTSTLQNPTHIYTTEGVYNVTLTVSNGCGSTTASSSVTTTDVPVSSFTRTPTTGCAPLTVNFTDTSTGTITSRLWNFGDGNTSTVQNPAHTYTTEGVKTVTLTVTNGCGSSVSTSSVTVTAIPAASFNASPTTGEAPLLVTFTDTSTGTITSWLWDFGDGGTSTLQNPTHTYTVNGDYVVTLTVSNTCGSDTANQNISLAVPCDPYFGYVSLLLHFDGGYTDSSSYTNTITNSGSSITTSVVKFGTGALQANGTSPGGGGANNISTILAPQFGICDADFTIECFAYLKTSVSAVYSTIFRLENNLGITALRYSVRDGSDVETSVINAGGSLVTFTTTNDPFTLNTWHHVAITRSGTTVYIFLDGVALNTSTISIPAAQSLKVIIGNQSNPGSTGWDGYIDELRITKGIARYTSTFTPPATAFPDISCTDFSIPAGVTVPETFAGLETFRLPTPAVVPETMAGLETFRLPTPAVVPETFSGLETFALPTPAVVPATLVGPTATDPYYSNVSILLHMDGTNGSTTFPDNSPVPKTVTANGIGQITTSVFKFGTGSFYTGLPGNTGWLQIPPSPDFIFGTGDFTIEGWFRPLSSGSEKVVFAHGVNTLGGLLVCVSINDIRFRAAGTNDLTVSMSISNTTFTHIAFVRSGNTRIIFVGGSQVASDTLSFNITDNVVTDIGASGNVGVNFRYDGYIDDFRVTKGVARYTSNFTPPTEPFPNS